MSRPSTRRLTQALVVALVGCAAAPALAQLRLPPSGEPVLSQVAFPGFLESLPAATPPGPLLEPALPGPAPLEAERFPYFAVGLRVGGYFFVDQDAEEIYGVLPLVGVDAKLHLFGLPLALATSVDWAFGTGDLDEIEGVTIVDADSEIDLYAWRLTVLLEPPPGAIGPESGRVYLTPYIGGGIGLHIVEQDVDAETTVGEISESASESVVGYHAVVGVDIVFGRLVSVGLEGSWSTAVIEDALDENVDIGGFGASLTVRLHF